MATSSDPRDFDIGYVPNPEDEREENLTDEPEVTPPPTIDPDERIELEINEEELPPDERPA